jgi:transposase
MPPKHQKYSEWSPERFTRWAAKIGPQTKVLTETLLVQRAHPQQAYRTLLGILRLGKSYGEQRLEAACDRALQINALSYRSIESILKNGLDQKPLRDKENNSKPLQHSNIRGADYYDSTVH